MREIIFPLSSDIESVTIITTERRFLRMQGEDIREGGMKRKWQQLILICPKCTIFVSYALLN